MAYLLETLGKGLVANLSSAFDAEFGPFRKRNLADLRRCVRAHPDQAAAHVTLGLCCIRHRLFSEARQAFSHALRLGAHQAVAELGMACVHDELGHAAQAIDMLLKARFRLPNEANIDFAIGFCLERDGLVSGSLQARAQLDTSVIGRLPRPVERSSPVSA